MKVQFKDGTIKNCTAPVEQKVFRNSEAVGWMLIFNLKGETTSNEVDALLTADNIKELTFIPDHSAIIEGEESEAIETTPIRLLNYDRVSSSAIRYAEDISMTRVEIQLSKGV